MRPLWKGAITFGLISIPVRLYSAVSEKSLKFHLMHEEDGGRIRYERVCSKCGKKVSWDDLVKGYEYSKDHYVTFTEDELGALDVDSIRAIDVVAFVPLADIDPIYFNKTYYVAPEAAGIKAYKLLADALEAEGQVGVAKIALRDKEHLATVRLKDDVFVLETMHWPDEIREPEFEELDKTVKIQDSEVKMARQLIQQLSASFEPSEFADEYRAKLEELVQAKVEGQEVTIAAEPEEEPTKVVDLMEALKASVEEAKKRRGSDDGAAKKKATRPATKASAS
ncbi:MAG TPA: Ku protein [Actinomycetota bacterium]|nr:Ku protein [Actinomycetota bacterium]